MWAKATGKRSGPTTPQLGVEQRVVTICPAGQQDGERTTDSHQRVSSRDGLYGPKGTTRLNIVQCTRRRPPQPLTLGLPRLMRENGRDDQHLFVRKMKKDSVVGRPSPQNRQLDSRRRFAVITTGPGLIMRSDRAQDPPPTPFAAPPPHLVEPAILIAPSLLRNERSRGRGRR